MIEVCFHDDKSLNALHSSITRHAIKGSKSLLMACFFIEKINR